MHKKLIALIAVVPILPIAILMVPTKVSYEREVEPQVVDEVEPPTQEILKVEPKLTHQQEVWKYALEWCESNGIPEAVNEEDLDGTPSYSSWQFKPSTLWYFAEKYGVPVPDTESEKWEALMDWEYQNSVITQMILHRDEIQWDKQFPWCVKKLGWPPRP